MRSATRPACAVGVGALPVEFLLRQGSVIFDQSLLVLFALLLFRWLTGHGVGFAFGAHEWTLLIGVVGAGRSFMWEARGDWLVWHQARLKWSRAH